jgi:hydrogenase nickel incorporation protein HypA/HybF
VHELGVANEVLAVVLSEAERNAACRVTAVTLRVGVLRAIEPGHLSFLFDHLARGTPAEGARLTILTEPVRVDCPSCGPLDVRSIVWECPRCRGEGIAATGGESLEVVSLEIDV